MSESAPGRGYVPPPPLDRKVVVGPCGVSSFANGGFPCTLAAGHAGSHMDEDGDTFTFTLSPNKPAVSESLVKGPGTPIEPYLPDLGPGTKFTALPVFDYSHELPDNATVVRTDVNDYKQDADKPPLMQAVFVPFGKTLLALAAMMEDMKHKHKLEGAKDPFQEWRQLPGGKWRLADAGARHGVVAPFGVNEADGKHLHILHGIWCWMAAYEKHLEETQS